MSKSLGEIWRIYFRRTEELAKERGCTQTFAIVTGNYSALAFDRLGHTLVKVGETFHLNLDII